MNFGWSYRPLAVHAYWASLELPRLFQALARLRVADRDGGQDVFFWELEQKVWGKLLPVWDQGQIGSCVSHGSGKAAEDVLTVQCAVNGDGVPDAEVAREPIYGGSRCEIGGQWGDNQDGSTGAWAAQWLSRYGVCFYVKYAGADLSDGYRVERCKQWGAEGAKPVEGDAKAHPVQDVAPVTSPEDAWAALGQWKPISICGNISRTMKRQANGFCPQTGNDWPHCQALRGRCTVKGGRRAVVYQNSWGDYLGSENNQVELESGRTIILPAGCYLSDLQEIGADLRQGDTFAYSHAVGFPPTTINWEDL
jgi:hypothetical protein